MARVAIVTGGTRGIGEAISLALQEAGMTVAANYAGNDERAREFTDRTGIKAFKWDVADYDACQAGVADVVATLGEVDVLVNNAGIQFVSPVEEFPIEKWDAIIAINLSSAFHGIRAAVPGMKKRGWGRIINTASAHSLVASPFKSAYVSAKHGIAGLTKTVALEIAHCPRSPARSSNRICPPGSTSPGSPAPAKRTR